MRKALVVGIDHYEHVGALHGCVNDSHAIKAILERHGDGTVNFGVKHLTGTSDTDVVNRGDLKDAVQELFADDSDIALFYFAGHGHIEATGGYLCGTDTARGDDGVSLGDVLHYANSSPAKNKVVILDSCHSGFAGAPPSDPRTSELTEGVTILTASTAEQYATEVNGSGVFTTLLVDAMGGAAANLVGEITPGSCYAHIDRSLGPWEQRPVFKTNVKSFVSLRTVPPTVELAVLRRITEFFPVAGTEFQLDPSFEPELKGRDEGMPPPNPQNTEKFDVLQKYNRVNLVVPVGAPHMWHAAMQYKTCKLTVLGEHYRRMVERQRI